MKPLQAKWIVELYDYLSSHKGQGTIANGWKATGITKAIAHGSKHLPSFNPFAAIDPLKNSNVSILFESKHLNPEEVSSFVTYNDDDDKKDEEWEMEDGPLKNIF